LAGTIAGSIAVAPVLDFLASVGRFFILFLQAAGRLALFTGTGVSHCFRPPFYPRLIGRQFIDIGYYSLPVVGLTALFTGMVLALQTHTGFSIGAETAVATIVVVAVTRELGPVIAGLMVAGRIGAAIAAEIGTMRVTDQIDALSTLSTNPYKYLVVPRLIAGTIALPVLVFIADIIGVFGGFLVATYTLGYNQSGFLGQMWETLTSEGVVSGLIKSAAFGFIVALMGCYHGYHSKGGAQGVGAATTYAVVSASIMILVTDYVLTAMFFSS
jgi:phospholipid/cholesterol/gamma-HCH transport system permease protein